MVEKLDMKGFRNKVIVKRENCVVKFYSIMCPLCINLAPIYEEISNEHGENFNFYKVSVDEDDKFSKMLKFDGVPTLFLFKDGKYEEIPYPSNPDILTGYRKSDIVDFIKEKVE